MVVKPAFLQSIIECGNVTIIIIYGDLFCFVKYGTTIYFTYLSMLYFKCY